MLFFLLLIQLFLPSHASAKNCPIPRFELYRAAKDKAQGLAGGAWKCESVTARELAGSICRNDIPELKQALHHLMNMNAFAVDEFFQSLA